MDRTTLMTCARAWTAAFLASTVLATTSLTSGIARAQDKGAEPAPPQGVARPADQAPHTVTFEVARPAPHSLSDWQDGEPIPPGYHRVQRMRKGAIIGGAVTFGVLYFVSLLIAAAGTDEANRTHTSNSMAGLYVPAVGPFIAMTQSSTAVGGVFLAMDGLAQAGGAALFIYGVASPQTVLIRNDYGRPHLLPQPLLFGRSGGGLGLVGSF
jgi:hypothetical protein